MSLYQWANDPAQALLDRLEGGDDWHPKDREQLESLHVACVDAYEAMQADAGQPAPILSEPLGIPGEGAERMSPSPAPSIDWLPLMDELAREDWREHYRGDRP